jgi:hypothetical protein
MFRLSLKRGRISTVLFRNVLPEASRKNRTRMVSKNPLAKCVVPVKICAAIADAAPEPVSPDEAPPVKPSKWWRKV